MDALQIAVRNPMPIKVGDAAYQLDYGLPVVAQMEGRLSEDNPVGLGRPMKTNLDWLRISPEELERVLHAGLLFFHKDEAAEVAATIAQHLPIEQLGIIVDALTTANYPLAMADWARRLEQMRDEAAAGIRGKG